VSTPATPRAGADHESARRDPSSDEMAIELTPVSGLGSIVEAEELTTGLRLTYRLVDVHEASPAEGRLSIASPVGMVLRARRPGEVVTATTPRGHRRLRIVSVT
jgi:transcription elongation GreA/GreB family factor